MTEQEFKNCYIYKTEYFKNYNDALNYLNKINYKTDNLKDFQIIYYANLNTDRELGFADYICEVEKPKKGK
jgi:hypothetical protein